MDMPSDVQEAFTAMQQQFMEHVADSMKEIDRKYIRKCEAAFYRAGVKCTNNSTMDAEERAKCMSDQPGVAAYMQVQQATAAVGQAAASVIINAAGTCGSAAGFDPQNPSDSNIDWAKFSSCVRREGLDAKTKWDYEMLPKIEQAVVEATSRL